MTPQTVNAGYIPPYNEIIFPAAILQPPFYNYTAADNDLKAFSERGNALAEQYSNIEVLDSVTVDGKFTLGENIGDLGGVLGAYDGLQKFYAENGRRATVWRTKSRDEALRTQVKTDPHSPGKVRATQPLLNIDAFYQTFDIKKGDAMYLAPEKRVRIW